MQGQRNATLRTANLALIVPPWILRWPELARARLRARPVDAPRRMLPSRSAARALTRRALGSLCLIREQRARARGGSRIAAGPIVNVFACPIVPACGIARGPIAVVGACGGGARGRKGGGGCSRQLKAL